MALNEEDAQSIVGQLQAAHRLVVAFYQRILPWFDATAGEFGCGFCGWAPLYTARPARSSTPPSGNWKWDFIPLYASEFRYERVGEDFLLDGVVGEGAIRFHLIIEDSFKPEKRKENGIKGSANALKLPAGEGIVELFVFLPTENQSSSFSQEWKKVDLPPCDGELHQLNDAVQAGCSQIPLAEVLANPNVLALRIEEMGLQKLPDDEAFAGRH